VGSPAEGVDLLLQAAKVKPDVVVVAQLADGGEPGICSHLLLEYPNLAVLLLPDSSEGKVLWRMVLRKESWQHASKEVLLAALKT